MEKETRDAIEDFFRFAATLGHGCGLVDGQYGSGDTVYPSPLLRLANALRKADPECMSTITFGRVVDRGTRRHG